MAPHEPQSRKEEQALARVDELVPEMIDAVQALLRIPTVNPPGDAYADCAEHLRRAYQAMGYQAALIAAEGHPDHSLARPRVNVMARREGAGPGPCVHFNGHLDVVPPGQGWSVDPFGGKLQDGKIYGRGACDMKAGIIASLYAVEAIYRAGLPLLGAVEQSATVDEETGGYAGVAYLAERGFLAPEKQHHVIITEPLDPDQICLGHRGVYWFEVTTHGHIAHGSMPFLGESAIDSMGRVLVAIDQQLRPRLAARKTALPVVPEGARHATINANALAGGQRIDEPQSPCVADRCTAIFDRRFLPEEPLEEVRREIQDLLQATGARFSLTDRMIVHPTATSQEAPVVAAVQGALRQLLGRPGALVASPGTYDQKHFARIGRIDQAIAYGPGRLHLAHQPDEHVAVSDLVFAAQVMALAVLRLQSPPG